MQSMVTKAELEQQLKAAQEELQALQAQADLKPVVVTARIPQSLREDMKRTAMQNGQNLQEFMVTAFTERLERLTEQD